MPTHPYFNKNGEPLPGTTSIISRWKESGGLLHWAHKVGYDQGLQRQRANLYEKRDKAGDIGTYIHALIEAHIQGNPLPDAPKELSADDAMKGINGFKQFREWEDQTGLYLVSWEKPLISERYRFGGTPDALGEMDGIVYLIDWKSSSGIYSDHLIQLAAYSILFEEAQPEIKLSSRIHVLRFSKTFSDFEHRSFDDLHLEKEQFLLYRLAYDNDKKIKERI